MVKINAQPGTRTYFDITVELSSAQTQRETPRHRSILRPLRRRLCRWRELAGPGVQQKFWGEKRRGVASRPLVAANAPISVSGWCGEMQGRTGRSSLDVRGAPL